MRRAGTMKIVLGAVVKLLLLFCGSTIRSIKGSATSSVSTVTCLKSGIPSPIPEEWMNDNYCDCPLDGGIDEPNTSACSGSSAYWAGIASEATSSSSQQQHYFTCLQQPNINLPPSKVMDGICDCCDGSDEANASYCKNICDEVLREERLQKEKLQQDFTKGFLKRSSALVEFQRLVEETSEKIQNLEQEKEEVEHSLQVASLSFSNLVAQERSAKQNLLLSVASTSPFFSFLNALSTEEKFQFVIAICYVTTGQKQQQQQQPDPAEFYYNLNSFISSTQYCCKPLFKSFFDMGYACRDKQEEEEKVVECTIDTQTYDIQDTNAPNGNRKNQPSSVKSEFDSSSSVVAPFHQHFYEQATVILQQIDQMYEERNEDDDDDDDVKDSDSNNNNNDEEPAEATNKSNPSAATINIDPMAVHSVKLELKERLQKIESSIDCAKLVTSIQVRRGTTSSETPIATTTDEADDQLQTVAFIISLLWHSKISSENVADLLYMIVPEFETTTKTNTEHANVCTNTKEIFFCPPPSPISRTVTNGAAAKVDVQIPPAPLFHAAVDRCQRRLASDKGVLLNAEASCSSSLEGNQAVIHNIPSNVPDGYLGYYEFVSRKEEDVLHQALSSALTAGNDTISVLEEARSKILELQSNKVTLDREIENFKEKIGGNDWKFGSNGILYLLNGNCYELTSGKYTYEICPFGKAYQRDVGSPSASGTSLGIWKGAEIRNNENSSIETIVLNFDGGDSCWNGPRRSAKVLVKCGVGTNLLSAEEPETCTYVLTMESHIACDEAFAEQHGLKLPSV